jgi:FtsZ-binding cell division protein ZapB
LAGYDFFQISTRTGGSYEWSKGITLVRSTGHVGIGTTTPLTRLHVAEGDIFLGEATRDNGFILHSRVHAGYDFFQISTRTGGSYEWSKGITLVRSSGNVGIGTTNPGTTLEVAGTITAGLRGGGCWLIINDITGARWRFCTGDYDLAIQNDYPAGTWSTKVLINENGNVGIGTTTPAYRLHVVGDVYATGNVYCYGWGICSDQRWKTNIKPIQNALDNVLKMQGVTYHWKVDEYPDKHFPEGEQIGFIAQEIEKVYPQVVRTDKDGYKSVDYSKLTPVLVEAIKEQQKIIEELQKIIQHLQEENSQIKQANAQLKQANAQLSAEIKMLNEKVDNLMNSLSNDKKLGYR